MVWALIRPGIIQQIILDNLLKRGTSGFSAVRRRRNCSKDNRLNLYATDLNLSDEEIDATWKIRWEIEKLHRDVKTLNLKSVEELLRFVEIRLEGALGLMKIFKLR